MDAIVNLVSSWPSLVQRAFSEHTLVVAFLTWWALPFVIDRHDSAVEGIRSSVRAISSQAGPVFLLALALIGINILGAIALGLGLLITVPLSTIASTYAYRVVSGRPPGG